MELYSSKASEKIISEGGSGNVLSFFPGSGHHKGRECRQACSQSRLLPIPGSDISSATVASLMFSLPVRSRTAELQEDQENPGLWPGKELEEASDLHSSKAKHVPVSEKCQGLDASGTRSSKSETAEN